MNRRARPALWILALAFVGAAHPAFWRTPHGTGVGVVGHRRRAVDRVSGDAMAAQVILEGWLEAGEANA